MTNEEYLQHHGILGQKWGVRRYQNPDGTLTDAGRKRYYTKAEIREAKKKLPEIYEKEQKARQDLNDFNRNLDPDKDYDNRYDYAVLKANKLKERKRLEKVLEDIQHERLDTAEIANSSSKGEEAARMAMLTIGGLTLATIWLKAH